MKKENIFLSTIAEDAPEAARYYGLGLEIAEYCTAWNMDEYFSQTDAEVQTKLCDVAHSLLHAPFNELFPCAIDKKAQALAKERYLQAIALAKHYGSQKVIIHGGYNPWIYYPIWYIEQSILFWNDFLKYSADAHIVLENVLETEPQWLIDIVKGVDDPRLKLCLDIGHVNAYSKIDLMQWLKMWAPYISHFHIHNNGGNSDEHNALHTGSIQMKEFLTCAFELCPSATFTLELSKTYDSVEWLIHNNLLEE